jgi:hypothetical protein
MKIRALNSNDLSALSNHIDDGIRQLRKPLLEAFDVYKSNIAYGVETETESERLIIMTWYKKLLDKDKTALVNIPQKIQRYL